MKYNLKKYFFLLLFRRLSIRNFIGLYNNLQRSLSIKIKKIYLILINLRKN
jgi:hypothetical protein